MSSELNLIDALNNIMVVGRSRCLQLWVVFFFFADLTHQYHGPTGEATHTAERRAAITPAVPIFYSGTYNPRTKSECVTSADLPQCTSRSNIVSAWAPTPLSVASYVGAVGRTTATEYYSILELPCSAGVINGSVSRCPMLYIGTAYSTAADEATTTSTTWFRGRVFSTYLWTLPATARLPYTVKNGVETREFLGDWACTFEAATAAACTTSWLATPSTTPWAWETLYSAWTVPPAQATLVPLTVLDAPTREEVEDATRPPWYASPAFPNAWAITARNASGATCPSPKQILDTFAIVNLLSAATGLVTGNQYVVRWVTCGWLGRHSTPHWSWAVLWVFPFGMHMAANAAVAALLAGDAAYKTELSRGALTMLFLTRPRVGPLPVLLAWQWAERKRKKKGGEGENPYASSAFANLVAELLLQVAGLYIIGLVVQDGVSNGRYTPGRYYSPPMDYYLVMVYVAALCYLVFCCFATVVGIMALSALVGAGLGDGGGLGRGVTGLSMFWQCLLWIMSWVFWNGFVKSALSQ